MRIEDLAEAAQVSVGTVYNYYRTKGDILIATVALEVEEILEAGRAIVADPPSGAETALLQLIFQYYDHSLEYLSKEMWRTAMALSIEAPGTPSGQRYRDLDRRLAAQVSDLVAALQARGEVRADLDAALFGEMVFHTLDTLFREFVVVEDMTLPALRARVGARIANLARVIGPV